MEKLIQNKISFLHKRKHDASHHQGCHLENQSLDLSQKIILMGQEQGQGSFGFPFTAKRKHSPSPDLRLKRTEDKYQGLQASYLTDRTEVQKYTWHKQYRLPLRSVCQCPCMKLQVWRYTHLGHFPLVFTRWERMGHGHPEMLTSLPRCNIQGQGISFSTLGRFLSVKSGVSLGHFLGLFQF